MFKDSAIIGPWISIKNFPDYMDVEFSLVVDDELRQHGHAKDMMMKPAELLVYISQFFPLCKGDIIFTGTPSGVGQIFTGSLATLHWGNKSFQVIWE